MRITQLHLQQVGLPLQTPFVTAHGTTTVRITTLVTVYLDNGYQGVGELTAFTDSGYLPETQASAWTVLQQEIAPLLRDFTFAMPTELAAYLQQHLRGNQLAQAAVETAVWAAYAQMQQHPLAELIGGQVKPVPVGISLGHFDSTKALLAQVAAGVAAGYQRVKLKLTGPADVAQVQAVRRLYPHLALMVDANSAFTTTDLPTLQQLDQLNLALIEQPLAADDFVEHAWLQRQLKTPLCLDENILSLADVQTAVALKSCRAINLKITRVGGLTAALAIVAYCRQQNLMVWCGGMLASGVSRAFDLALASRAEFVLPGDISASARYFQQDVLAQPLVLQNGCLQLAPTPGLGATVAPVVVAQYLQHELWLQL
ncbi:o-succinylbenzoate synthase [Loigolactobacillus jiayinensis]|uniref:o-succinylbenzoate synthase n=1 Tax=Loigolactobacillus jiayinensis TaxID=2486016 RepID=A0ABW1RIT5_9LACO|nr:o-succinylbenzoate synthase [Loigolactobacillus jiayinensis]